MLVRISIFIYIFFIIIFEPYTYLIHLCLQIFRLEAKINMWKAAAVDAKDPVRVAYCEGRIMEIVKRIDLVNIFYITASDINNYVSLYNHYFLIIS